MSYIISGKELVECLNNLKKMLSDLNYSNIYNVIFYNFDSYISYVNNQCSKKKYSVELILSKIEKYIPFDFDEKTIDFLITSAFDDYDPEFFQSLLIKRAKVDFINSIKTADTKDEWNKIVDECKNIHEYHENNGLLYI